MNTIKQFIQNARHLQWSEESIFTTLENAKTNDIASLIVIEVANI